MFGTFSVNGMVTISMPEEKDRHLKELITAEREHRLRFTDIRATIGFGIRVAWFADRRRVVFILAAQILQAVGLGLVLLFFQQAFRDAFAGNGWSGALSEAVIPIVVLLIMGTVYTALMMVVFMQQQILQLKIERDAVAQVTVAASEAELVDFDRPAFHNRVERAVWAAETHLTTVVISILSALQGVLTVAAVGAAVVVMAWWLLPLLVAAAAPIVREGLQERRAEYAMNVKLMDNRRLRGYLLRLLTGRDEAKEVRAFGLAPTLIAWLVGQYAERLDWERTYLWRYLIRGFQAQAISNIVIGAAVAAVLVLVGMGWIEMGAALAVLGGVYLLAQRIRMVSSMSTELVGSLPFINDLRSFTAGVSRADTAADTAADTEEQEQISPFTALEARDVSFTYPAADTPAITDVSLTLRAGEVVALVGPNGSGKSTVAKLLTGLYRPQTGALLWDGQPLTDRTRLRSVSTVLFQDFLRYKFTAANNIGLGRPQRLDDTGGIALAARKAGADGIIQDLPRSYQTLLSTEFSEGVDLSLGQWQRIAIARAFFRDAPFIVLDEPTAALDPRAEAEFFAVIRELFADRTVLLISHRFSSVRAADRIYVLEAGKLMERGSHEELMAVDGTYAEMFLLQAAAYRDESAVSTPAGERGRGTSERSLDGGGVP